MDDQPLVFEVHVLQNSRVKYTIIARGSGDTTFKAEVSSRLKLFSKQEVSNASQWLERGLFDQAYIQEFGGRLFQTLFTGQILEGYRANLSQAQQSGRSLRILLTFDPPLLAQLPWELMYDKDGEQFLCRSSRIHIVRHLSSSTPIPLDQTIHDETLRILVITASPQGYPIGGAPEEITHILTSFKDSNKQVEIHVLESITCSQLKNELRGSEAVHQGYHILHFIGHGESDSTGGYLIFQNDDGKADHLSALSLAELLASTSIKLVFLNACKSAQLSSLGLANSVAQAVVDKGIPTVLAMQVNILDQMAVEFAKEFYSSLADGEIVEQALQDARQITGYEEGGKAGDWAIPVLYSRRASGPILDFDISHPGFFTRSWNFITTHRVTIGLTTVIVIILAFTDLISIPNVILDARAPGGLLSTWYPLPMEKGLFNIAVADFQVIGTGDRSASEHLTQEFTAFLKEEIVSTADELKLQVEVRGPNEVSDIFGNTAADRAKKAEALANQINANIVIYGVVIVDGSAAIVVPEFYVRQDDFYEANEATTGHYRLGTGMPVDKLDNLLRQQAIDGELAKRSKALIKIIYGIEAYVIGQYEVAEHWFGQALEINKWEGQDVIYVLLGNAAGQRRDLEKAKEYYNMALSINPKYSRAYIGLGGVFYLEALGTPSANSFDNVDLNLLDQAIETHKRAVDSANEFPPLADVETKMHFGLGQAYLLKAQMVTNTYLSLAAEEFNAVIADYNDGPNYRIKERAAHSYAHLGLINRLNGNSEGVIQAYQQAIELLPPLDRTLEKRAFYAGQIGDIYAILGEKNLAQTWYEQAVNYAPIGSESKQHYQEKLN